LSIGFFEPIKVVLADLTRLDTIWTYESGTRTHPPLELAMSSPYAWTITRDLIDSDAKGVCGPRGCTMTSEEIRNHPNAEKFIMKDDDGESYYHGYYLTINEDECEDCGFEPLDDFGEPNAGCTSIWYKNQEGEWSML